MLLQYTQHNPVDRRTTNSSPTPPLSKLTSSTLKQPKSERNEKILWCSLIFLVSMAMYYVTSKIFGPSDAAGLWCFITLL
jgi:hypothetical protein